MTDHDHEETPVLYRLSLIAYEALEKSANENGIWEGGIVSFLEDHGIPQSRYSYVMKALRRMGCITKLRRGANQSPSVIQLHQRPTIELYREGTGSHYAPGLNLEGGGIGRDRGGQSVQQQINDLAKRSIELEQGYEQLERRLQSLEESSA